MNVHTVTRSGQIGEEIVAEIQAGGYYLVVPAHAAAEAEPRSSSAAPTGTCTSTPESLLSISGDESNSEALGEGALRCCAKA